MASLKDNSKVVEDFLRLWKVEMAPEAQEALAELLTQTEERAYEECAEEAFDSITGPPVNPHRGGCSCHSCYGDAVRQGISTRIKARVLRPLSVFTPKELRVLRRILKKRVPKEDTIGAILSSCESALLGVTQYVADRSLAILSEKIGDWSEEDESALKEEMQFQRKVREQDGGVGFPVTTARSR